MQSQLDTVSVEASSLSSSSTSSVKICSVPTTPKDIGALQESGQVTPVLGQGSPPARQA